MKFTQLWKLNRITVCLGQGRSFSFKERHGVFKSLSNTNNEEQVFLSAHILINQQLWVPVLTLQGYRVLKEVCVCVCIMLFVYFRETHGREHTYLWKEMWQKLYTSLLCLFSLSCPIGSSFRWKASRWTATGRAKIAAFQREHLQSSDLRPWYPPIPLEN